MSRHFENNFRKYSADTAKIYLDDSLHKLSDSFLGKIRDYEKERLPLLGGRLLKEVFSSDCAFTGSAGIAYLFYQRSKKSQENESRQCLLEAAKYIQNPDHRRPRVTFLCGAAGPLALGAVIGHQLGPDRPKQLLEPHSYSERLTNLWSVAKQSNTPDEILYGRCGYLYSLLFVNEETSQKYIDESLIREVIKRVIESGVELASRINVGNTPLMYEWHDSYYLGGAHGIAGILYIILQAKEYTSDDVIKTYIIPTLDWLLSMRYVSGNYPSTLGSQNDRLVQWCHGVPGFVQLCCLAFQLFGNQKYLDHAMTCGEVVWTRGLCKKGYSICHGVAGNAYTFLQLYQMTKDPMQLYRACCFADWCINEAPGTELHQPDAPASLFEGLAGRLYFLSDVVDPANAKFPGYTL